VRGRDATKMRIQCALELLARNWPVDYLDDAVEWSVFKERARPHVYVEE
jgi:hypothetical protein